MDTTLEQSNTPPRARSLCFWFNSVVENYNSSALSADNGEELNGCAHPVAANRIGSEKDKDIKDARYPSLNHFSKIAIVCIHGFVGFIACFADHFDNAWPWSSQLTSTLTRFLALSYLTMTRCLPNDQWSNIRTQADSVCEYRENKIQFLNFDFVCLGLKYWYLKRLTDPHYLRNGLINDP